MSNFDKERARRALEREKFATNDPPGIFRKYDVTRIYRDENGNICDAARVSECFVLRIDRDPHARLALLTYADSVNTSDNYAFANELREWIKSYE